MPTTSTGLKSISLICIPVNDQDRALEFYVGALGLEKTSDTAFGDGDYRWVEVSTPEGAARIALAPPPPGTEAAGGMQTGIILTTDDVDATHAALTGAGIDVDERVSRMGDPVPPMFWLRDPEANVLMIAEDQSS